MDKGHDKAASHDVWCDIIELRGREEMTGHVLLWVQSPILLPLAAVSMVLTMELFFYSWFTGTCLLVLVARSRDYSEFIVIHLPSAGLLDCDIHIYIYIYITHVSPSCLESLQSRDFSWNTWWTCVIFFVFKKLLGTRSTKKKLDIISHPRSSGNDIVIQIGH